jgi:flagellar hook-associated protein 2
MASISSTGLGSGLDVNSIVTQLVAIEKKPLTTLALKATNIQNQISSFAQVQSQISALTDVATRIADATTWGARKATSSYSGSATITATGVASAATFSLDVDQLAQPQSVSSAPLAVGAKPGAGTLTLQLGTWAAGGASFTPASATAVPPTVDVTASDTLASIATKINAANAGVTASVFNDGTNERLLLNSKSTGAAAGFKVTASTPALNGLVFDPATAATGTMADSPVQYSQDAKARINGLAVTSPTNTLTNNLPGVTISLLATTTTGYVDSTHTGTSAPLTMRIAEDVTPAVKNVNDFVTAYNTLNKTLADLTKYDKATKTAGLFQGDSAVVGLQNVLRSMLSSSSLGATSQRLSDVGLQRQLDGSLTINTDKLSLAANNGTSLQQLFTNNNSDPLTNGFALKFKALGQGVLGTGGSVSNESAALQKVLKANTAAQTKVTDAATLFETRLRARYSALDTQMASLNALNSYVSQQVTLWNKSTA